jgi:hypothetical protein
MADGATHTRSNDTGTDSAFFAGTGNASTSEHPACSRIQNSLGIPIWSISS